MNVLAVQFCSERDEPVGLSNCPAVQTQSSIHPVLPRWTEMQDSCYCGSTQLRSVTFWLLQKPASM